MSKFRYSVTIEPSIVAVVAFSVAYPKNSGPLPIIRRSCIPRIKLPGPAELSGNVILSGAVRLPRNAGSLKYVFCFCPKKGSMYCIVFAVDCWLLVCGVTAVLALAKTMAPTTAMSVIVAVSIISFFLMFLFVPSFATITNSSY